MEKLFIFLLSVCVSLFVAELLFFIEKGIILIACAIIKEDAKVDFKNNIIIISILSFLITFLLLIF